MSPVILTVGGRFSSSLPTISGAHSSSAVASPQAYSTRSDTCGYVLNPMAKVFEPLDSLHLGVSVCHDTSGDLSHSYLRSTG